MATALRTFRICDLTGQLAGAGATKWLAAFGAEVIRIEDPVREGRWDILRGIPPFKPGQSGLDCGGELLADMAAGGPPSSCGYDDHSLPPCAAGGSRATTRAATSPACRS